MAALAAALDLPLTVIAGKRPAPAPLPASARARAGAAEWLNLGVAPEDARSLVTVIDGVLQMVDAVFAELPEVKVAINMARKRRDAAMGGARAALRSP